MAASLMGRLCKFAIVCHRWLGLSCCPLFVMWLTSGIVMMYSGYPSVSPEEHFAKAAALTPAQIHLSPVAAFSRLAGDASEQVRLTMLDGRPVYRFLRKGTEAIVRADDGERLLRIPGEMALRIAATWTGQAASAAVFEGSLKDPDQWTVPGEFRALRPLFKYSWADGEEVYVSAVTGEVVQHTTRRSRLAAYFGAIPHWLYFTPLRKNERLWNTVVIWTSGIGTMASLLGLIAGVGMYSASKRIPYIGCKRWHVMLGLLFGAATCTWVFSGMRSMQPTFGIEGSGVRIANALRGGPLALQSFQAKPPGAALQQVSETSVKELELVFVGGEAHYLARESPGRSRIVPVQGNTAEEFDSARILRLIADGVRPATMLQTRLVTEYEAYYLDRRHQHPLPALFVGLSGPDSVMYYIDLKTARIVESYDGRARWNRWLYHGLHSLDLPWLYRHRPVWDVVVLVLLLGGACLSLTSVIIGVQLLRRKLG
ncbi:MAG: PepSY domain-containing protein [Candidatus Solibacter usitatus]|nr:PepSY domain-containing protein [Candidatus Solibacter usitatus]